MCVAMAGDERLDRKNDILIAAVEVIQAQGYTGLTRERVAQQAKVSVGLVNLYYGTMHNLRDEVMHAAIRQRLLPVIAQGLALGDTVARNAPHELRTEALATLSH